MVLHQHTPHLCLPTQSKNEYIRTMSAIAARPLKRLASSDIDDPPSRHPAPPQFEGTTAPGTASATVDVRHSLALSSPSLLPLVSTPTSLDATIASLTVSMASDVGDSPKLPSSPPSQLESPTTRTLVLPDLIINQSPRSPASPNQRTSSVIIIPDSSSPIAPPPSQPVPLLSAPDIPLNANVSSSAPASPSPVHNCSATPDPDTQDSDNDTEEIDSDSDACAYTQLECRMTHSPRLDLIVPCARYVKDVVILLTSTKLSPVRWTWIGPTTTYILHGFNFVMAYNKSLPASYSKVLVTTINDTIPIPLRKRINRAIPMPDKPHYGLCGLSQPLSTLAHMAAMFLNQRDGGGLITTFSWQEPRSLSTFDIVPRSLLDEHVRKYPRTYPWLCKVEISILDPRKFQPAEKIYLFGPIPAGFPRIQTHESRGYLGLVFSLTRHSKKLSLKVMMQHSGVFTVSYGEKVRKRKNSERTLKCTSVALRLEERAARLGNDRDVFRQIPALDGVVASKLGIHYDESNRIRMGLTLLGSRLCKSKSNASMDVVDDERGLYRSKRKHHAKVLVRQKGELFSLVKSSSVSVAPQLTEDGPGHPPSKEKVVRDVAWLVSQLADVLVLVLALLVPQLAYTDFPNTMKATALLGAESDSGVIYGKQARVHVPQSVYIIPPRPRPLLHPYYQNTRQPCKGRNETQALPPLHPPSPKTPVAPLLLAEIHPNNPPNSLVGNLDTTPNTSDSGKVGGGGNQLRAPFEMTGKKPTLRTSSIFSIPRIFANAMGGTNLRVRLIALQGEGKFKITQTNTGSEEQKHNWRSSSIFAPSACRRIRTTQQRMARG
ncbi:hypothetical protein BD410DRAFT_810067 [Rickenella mellea]|uniref:Uncharacterized protein n=1 Tax=Rickenella mellea TaxID=50990 RepID=A0A4Y7PG46_9AGAM|nr:hypothetical protein BD410DRAFT_810067 [Rickenella mellea]